MTLLAIGLTLFGIGIATAVGLLLLGRDPVRARALTNLERGTSEPLSSSRRAQGNLGFSRLIDSPARRSRLEGAIAKAGYDDLAMRTGSTPLRRFLRTVIQAEAYGIPLADVLTAQAGEMRIARRQNAEKKAMEIPVKVVFPLILCILPVIFLMILGPAAISAYQVFSGLR